jgi:hypothetical protein
MANPELQPGDLGAGLEPGEVNRSEEANSRQQVTTFDDGIQGAQLQCLFDAKDENDM